MKKWVGALSILMLLAAGGMAGAEIYRWVDENGGVHFSDQAPEGNAGVERHQARPALEVGPGAGKQDEGNTNGGKAVPVRKSWPKVELYTTSWCGYCRQAKEFLTSQGVPFSEYDIEKNTEAARRFKKVNPSGGVPVAVIGGRKLVGYSQRAYAQALGLP